jgi:asparagine synthase (glutamine-hydrolysing)
MCGIAGIYSFNSKIDRSAIVRFTDSIAHRGPDGSDYRLLNEDRVAFGHRRLSIIDLSEGGKQPMSYADERFWITFNGEIYNFIELKSELEKKGYAFKTDSDTEVILAAYHCWGHKCLDKFNGMFALAIWDNSKQSLFVARDRFGVKPLHYVFKRGEFFAFASETYAFKFLDQYERKINDKNISIALINPDHIEGSGHTIYHDLFQLLPGHYIELNNDTAKISQQKWWETKDNHVKVPGKYSEQVEMFGELFTDACRLRLRSDVPVASALSGGMDSSSVYCILNALHKNNKGGQHMAPEWQQAFVAYFPGTENDEKQYASEVIKYTQGKVTYVEPVYNDLVNELEKTTLMFDGISSTPVICATDVYKAMSGAGMKVSMDGHGVDEMLYGYKQMVFNAYQTAVLRNDNKYEANLLDTYTNLFFPEERTKAQKYLSDYGRSIKPSFPKSVAYQFFPSLMEQLKRKNLYDGFSNQKTKWKWNTLNNSMYLDPLSKLHFANYVSGNAEADTYNLFHYTSLPINLRDFDRASMQNGIEIRSPFMDWRLVSFVFSLPMTSKVGGGYTKRILRDFMKDKMPESIRTRKLKIGLNAPLVSWFNNQLKEYVLDEVSASSFQSGHLWDGPGIKKYVEERRISGWENFLQCLEVWRYINAGMLITNNSKRYETTNVRSLRT